VQPIARNGVNGNSADLTGGFSQRVVKLSPAASGTALHLVFPDLANGHSDANWRTRRGPAALTSEETYGASILTCTTLRDAVARLVKPCAAPMVLRRLKRLATAAWPCMHCPPPHSRAHRATVAYARR